MLDKCEENYCPWVRDTQKTLTTTTAYAAIEIDGLINDLDRMNGRVFFG